MSIRTVLLRMLALWALAFWLGGFTFYSAVVIPVLHDRLGSPLETGLVTQRVTDALNLLGVATITLGWLVILFEEPSQQSATGRRRWVMRALAVTTVCLVILMALHRVLDRRLDAAERHGFYPLHRLYLWVSTVQWVANLSLLTCWASVGRGCCRQTQGENRDSSPNSTRSGLPEFGWLAAEPEAPPQTRRPPPWGFPAVSPSHPSGLSHNDLR